LSAVMPAHSRLKDGVATLAYVAGTTPWHQSKAWMAGTSPDMTNVDSVQGVTALGNSDDRHVGISGADHVADLLAHQRARHRRNIRQRAMRGVGLVLADDAPGLLPP